MSVTDWMTDADVFEQLYVGNWLKVTGKSQPQTPLHRHEDMCLESLPVGARDAPISAVERMKVMKRPAAGLA